MRKLLYIFTFLTLTFTSYATPDSLGIHSEVFSTQIVDQYYDVDIVYTVDNEFYSIRTVHLREDQIDLIEFYINQDKLKIMQELISEKDNNCP